MEGYPTMATSVRDAQARLQRAIDSCHSATTARYLRQGAAACLKHGLQPAASDSAPHIQFELQPVSFELVEQYVKEHYPSLEAIIDRLQGRTAIKYFTVTTFPARHMVMRVHDLILPPQRHSVREILASIKPFGGFGPPVQQAQHTQHASQKPELAAPSDQPAPVATPVRKSYAAAPSAYRSSQDVEQMRTQLHAAIARSHGSHTARWMTETARVCLNHGLTSAASGLQLAPVDTSLVAQHLRCICLDVYDIKGKLQTPTGLKYFRLVGPGRFPTAVLLRLADIIPRPTHELADLISSVKVIDHVEAGSGVQAVQTSQPPGFEQDLALPDNLDPTPKAAAASTEEHASGTFGASSPAAQHHVVEAQAQLKVAIGRSHPPTAGYIVETAVSCIDNGLQASGSGLVLRPVAWSVVTAAVYKKCPRLSDLLEKLCGRVGQRYFQLLGNSEYDEPEFVGANLEALIMPSQMHHVRGVLAQLQGKAQQRQASSPLPAVTSASMTAPIQAVDAVKQLPTIHAKPEGQHAALLPAGVAAASSVIPGASYGTPANPSPAQKPKVVYVPVPAAKSSNTDSDSTPAMQALMSACNAAGSAPPGLVQATAAQTAAAQASAAAKTAAILAAQSATARIVDSIRGPPSQPISSAGTANTEGAMPASAAAAQPAFAEPAAPDSVATLADQGQTRSVQNPHAVYAEAEISPNSSPISSASGVTQAMKARSAASADLSPVSTAAENGEPTALSQQQQQKQQQQQHMVDPFCLDCMAEPGGCARHPLVPVQAGPASPAVLPQLRSYSPSDHSSQGHIVTDCTEPVHVAIVIKLVPLSEPKKLSFIQVWSVEAKGVMQAAIQPLQHERMLVLKQYLEDDSKLKVVHNVAQVAKHLATATERITNVFDTQVAQGMLDHIHSLVGRPHLTTSPTLQELSNLHAVDVDDTPEGFHIGDSTPAEQEAAAEAAALLRLAGLFSTKLGPEGMRVVTQLTQSLLQKSLEHGLTTPQRELECLPRNVDLALAFKEDGNRNYVPIMEVLESQHQPATPEVDDRFGKDWEADPALQSFLGLLPLDVKNAVLTCSKNKVDALMMLQSNGMAASNFETGRHTPRASSPSPPSANLPSMNGVPSLSPSAKIPGKAGVTDGQNGSTADAEADAGDQCNRCGKWGHSSSSCSEQFCDYCQQGGHSIKSCEIRRSPQSSASGSRQGSPVGPSQNDSIANESSQQQQQQQQHGRLLQSQSQIEGVADDGGVVFGRSFDGAMLTHISADEGRPVLVRFSDGTAEELPMQTDIEACIDHLAYKTGKPHHDLFLWTNSLRLDRSLHQVSVIRDCDQERSIVGLTYRLGRHIPGVSKLILDIISQLASQSNTALGYVQPKSLLLSGPPQTGKTTLLRDIANTLAGQFNQHVLVFDTHTEIGGNCSAPHESLGKARRIPVRERSQQHEQLLDAALNHKPQVVVVDAISTVEDAAAVTSLLQRGIAVVAAAEAASLSNLVHLPHFSALLGMSQPLSAERVAPRTCSMSSQHKMPFFAHVIEVLQHGKWRVYKDGEMGHSSILAGKQLGVQLRSWKAGKMKVRLEAETASGA